ncbi:MAG: nucleoside-diphosphate kinase [Acidobacteriota bacterium]
MASERTLAIIKPDAVAKGVFGEAVRAAEQAGLRVVAVKRLTMTRRQAEGFYAVHRERPFFGDLTAFMSSGPSIVMVLEGEGAIGRWRELLGATDPAQAAEGTLRRRFGENIQNNGFHGSDAPETAAFEIGYMFSGLELAGA